MLQYKSNRLHGGLSAIVIPQHSIERWETQSVLTVVRISILMDLLVSGVTHMSDHTLDLVFSLGLDIDRICREDLLISDHKYIFFDLSVNADPFVS